MKNQNRNHTKELFNHLLEQCPDFREYMNNIITCWMSDIDASIMEEVLRRLKERGKKCKK